MSDLQGHDFLDNHEVDKESGKDDQERAVDEDILHQSSENPLPHREIARQHVRLTQGYHHPAWGKPRPLDTPTRDSKWSSPGEHEEQPVYDVPEYLE